MTDAPERIWSCDGCRATGYWHCSMPDHCGYMVEYIRADLPPTLAQALAVPEVKALVEKARGLMHEVAFMKPTAGLLAAFLAVDAALRDLEAP